MGRHPEMMNAIGPFKFKQPKIRGFTLTDLLVSVAVAAALSATVFIPLVRAREKTRLAACAANLHEIGRALLSYSGDHSQALPGVIASETGNLWWWYKEQVKRYVGLTGPSSANDRVFACPNDRGYSDPIPFHSNPRFDYGSYVYNGVTIPGVASLAGWRLDAVKNPKKTLLVMEWTAHAPLAWHYSKTGKRNMPFYCDAQSMVGYVDGHASFTRIYYDGYNAAYTQDPPISGYEYQYSGN
jgi:type II secretory pathway pseudopilin PulG